MYREIKAEKVIYQDIITVTIVDIGDVDDEVSGFRIYQDLEYDEPVTFKKLEEEIAKRNSKEGLCAIVLAENPTNGEMFKYNIYGNKEWFKTGETMGYA